MTTDLALNAIGEQARKVDQMEGQTVIEAARLGQMILDYRGEKPDLDSLSRVITTTGYQQAHVFRLIKLAKHWPELEHKHPVSIRQALKMLELPKSEQKAIPAPERTVATPQQQPEPAPEQKEPEPLPGGAIAALNAACDALNKTEQKAMQKVGQKMMAAIAEQFWKQVDEEVAKRFPTERERLEEARQKATEALRESTERETVFRKLQQGIEPLLSMDEFKLIRGCLHADRVPEDLKPRFDKAFVAFNKVSPYFERLQKAKDRAEKQSERSKAMWEARKAS